MGNRRKEEKAFQSSLRQKLNMPEPEATLQDSWTALEEGVVGIKASVDALQANTKDGETSKEIADATVALAEGLETVVASIEAVEEMLVEQGIIEDDELLEPEAASS